MNKVILFPAGAIMGMFLSLLAGVAWNSPDMAIAQTAEKEPPPPPEKIKTPREQDRQWIVVAARTVEGRSVGKFVMYNPRTGESYATNNGNKTWERMIFRIDPTKAKSFQLLPSSRKK